MKIFNLKTYSCAQTAIEYLLLLAVVGVVVIASFQRLVPQIHNASEGYYNTVSDVILGPQSTGVSPQPIHGNWCEVKCPSTPGVGNPVGNPVMYRTCECPSPAFGGTDCSDPSNPLTHGVGNSEVHCNETAPSVSCGACNIATPPACGQIVFGTMDCTVAGNLVNQVCSQQGPPCPH